MVGKSLLHYKIESELGRGGMGIVYRARDTELERDVALKVMSTLELASIVDRERFRIEAQAAASLNHPNIATVYQIGEDDGKMFIAMELVEGESLETIVERGALDPDFAENIAAQVAEGLGAAHDNGIVHRDVKPGNIMLGREDRVKILDFGLAKTTNESNLTGKGATVGTVGYMSPEQLRGEEVTSASDVWSFGVLLFEMLSGSRPFDAAYDAALSFQILNEPAPDMDDSVPEPLRTGIQSCLEKDPNNRPSDIRDILSATVAHTGKPSSPVAAGSSQNVASRKSVIIGVLGTIAVVAAAATWFFSRPAISPPYSQPDGIVIAPFTAAGDASMSGFGNSFARLLGGKLESSGHVRVIDHNTTVRQIDLDGLDTATPEGVQLLATSFSAEGYIFGDIVQLPGAIVINASLYAADGTLEAEATTTIAEETELLGAVDELGRSLLVDKYRIAGDELRSYGAQTTTSYPALKAYLDGMDLLSAVDADAAFVRFRDAVEIDSTFAVAWMGMAQAAGWMQEERNNQSRYLNRALEHSSALSSRLNTLLRANIAINDGDLETAESLLVRMTHDYPNEARAWSLRGEVAFHFNATRGIPGNSAERYLRRSMELAPANLETSSHLLTLLLDEGDFGYYKALVVDHSLSRNRPVLEWIPEVLTDSLWRDHPATDSLLENIATWQVLHFISAFSEDPWLLFEYAEHAIDAKGPHRSVGFMTWYGRGQIATGQVREGWKLWAEISTGLSTPAITDLARFPTLYPPHKNILDDALLEWQQFDSSDLNARAKLKLDFAAASVALWAGEIATFDSLSAEVRLSPELHAEKIEHILRAMRHNTQGEFELALKEADSGYIGADIRNRLNSEEGSPGAWEYFSRWTRIEALYGLGEHEETIRWIDALGDGDVAMPATGIGVVQIMTNWAAAAYMRGKSNLALGNLDEAEADFVRFVELFQKADPEYQHLVDDARSEVQRIVDQRIQEGR